MGRQALGYEVLHKSMLGISARSLELLGRLKSPPPMLGDVMHCVMVLLRKALPPRVPSFDQPLADEDSADKAKPADAWCVPSRCTAYTHSAQPRLSCPSPLPRPCRSRS